MKVARNEKRKKLLGFSFYINIGNFEAFLRNLNLSAKHLFWTCDCERRSHHAQQGSTCFTAMTSIVRPKRGPAKGFPKKARSSSRLKATRLAHEGFLVPQLAKLPRLDGDSSRFVPKNPPFFRVHFIWYYTTHSLLFIVCLDFLFWPSDPIYTRYKGCCRILWDKTIWLHSDIIWFH